MNNLKFTQIDNFLVGGLRVKSVKLFCTIIQLQIQYKYVLLNLQSYFQIEAYRI